MQNPNMRWRKDGSGYKPSKAKHSRFWNSIQKHGWHNFKSKILFDNLTKEMATKLEIELIHSYDSTNRDKGYNAHRGGIKGEGGHTEESKQKLREVNLGHTVSEETKKKISASLSGCNHPNYGKNLSEETKIRIGNAQKGEKSWMYGKKGEESIRAKAVVQLDKNTEEFIAKYPCLLDGVKATNQKSRANITMCCQGKRKTAGGYKWMYADDYYNALYIIAKEKLISHK